ncbi:MAG: hypothetical protein ACJ8F7_11290 [Gemmataceae bacterium]
MHTVTFSCSHCNNLMAVGADHLGQQVRCPTCQHVVDSPTAAPPPLEAPALDLRLDAGKEESHESIFGEHHDEDVFGSKPVLPEIPAESAANSISGTQFASYPPPPHLVPVPSEAGAGDDGPNLTLEAAAALPPAPEEPWYVSATPAAAPPPQPEAQFANEPASIERPTPASWIDAQPAQGHDGEPLRVRHPQETLERRKGANLAITILAPYAVLMTLVAIWYFWKYQNYESSHHPLEMLGDVGRVDLPRKKDGSQTFKMPPPDTPLPERLKVKLGGTVTVGDLQVTPMRIEEGKFTYYSVARTGQAAPHLTGKEGLILHLRLKNISPQWAFCPTDPLFERSFDPERHDKSSRPYTLIEAGGKMFFGGPLDQQNLGTMKRLYVQGQENDEAPLNPGEERQTVVCSNPANDAVLAAVTNSAEPITWRVHLRRGVMQYRGHDYSVTAVIGVEFSASDIKKIAKN